jgi:hypothetical protein
VKIVSAIVIAAACIMLGDANAQPLDRNMQRLNRNEVCAALAAVHGTLLGDNLRPDQRSGVMYVHNFDSETYDCEDRSYLTGDVLPAYFGIGFSEDGNEAFVAIQTMPTNEIGIGRGYSCILLRADDRAWRGLGCRAIDVRHHQPPPNPIPVP